MWNFGLYAFYVMFSLLVLIQVVVWVGAVYLLYCLWKYILPMKIQEDEFVSDGFKQLRQFQRGISKRKLIWLYVTFLLLDTIRSTIYMYLRFSPA